MPRKLMIAEMKEVGPGPKKLLYDLLPATPGPKQLRERIFMCCCPPSAGMHMFSSSLGRSRIGTRPDGPPAPFDDDALLKVSAVVDVVLSTP